MPEKKEIKKFVIVKESTGQNESAKIEKDLNYLLKEEAIEEENYNLFL